MRGRGKAARRIELRLTREEHEEVEVAAWGVGLSVAAFVRQAALAEARRRSMRAIEDAARRVF